MDNEPREPVESPKAPQLPSNLNRRARRALLSCARRGMSQLETWVKVGNARWQRGNGR